jgi:2-isopropylmalate synthase
MAKIVVFDTTLRDGELTDGVRFAAEDRIAIAAQLAACGVDVIEVAVAGASGALDSVPRVAREVRSSTLCVLAPATGDAIDAAGAALQGAAAARIHVYQGGLDASAALESVDAIVRRAKRHVDDVEFTAIQGTSVHLDAVVAAAQVALRAGATTIGVADTAGRTLPNDVAQRIRDLRVRVPELDAATLSFHGHDDLGLATANTLAAVLAGARQVEVAVNGLGARAGNAALEEIAAAVHEHGAALGIETGIDVAALATLSGLVEERSRIALSTQKAIVGRHARWRWRTHAC